MRPGTGVIAARASASAWGSTPLPCSAPATAITLLRLKAPNSGRVTFTASPPTVSRRSMPSGCGCQATQRTVAPAWAP